jgi:hypothetical protein
LAVSGTLGVLDLANRVGLVNLRDALDRLKATNFRASPRVLKHFGGSGDTGASIAANWGPREGEE